MIGQITKEESKAMLVRQLVDARARRISQEAIAAALDISQPHLNNCKNAAKAEYLSEAQLRGVDRVLQTRHYANWINRAYADSNEALERFADAVILDLMRAKEQGDYDHLARVRRRILAEGE